MYLLGDIKCEQCYKPVGRRLGLFEARDDYECYAERYVKCFWGLCDRRHTSQESILSKPDGKGSFKLKFKSKIRHYIRSTLATGRNRTAIRWPQDGFNKSRARLVITIQPKRQERYKKQVAETFV